MDKLTDVLTTFFVNKKTNTYIDTHTITHHTINDKVTENDESNLYVSQNVLPDSSETESTLKSKLSIKNTKNTKNMDHESESTVSESESTVSESKSNESESTVSESKSSESKSTESKSTESKTTVSESESAVSESESAVSESKSSESESTVSSLSSSDETKEKLSKTSKSSIISYLTETVICNKKKEKDVRKKELKEHKDGEVKEKNKEEESKEYKLEKYSLNSVDLYNKNMVIINEYKKDNIDILNNILYKLNLLKNISNIYANNVHIITSNENKKLYKKILLDNPYLYFINFDFKQEISQDFLERCDNIQKRSVVIIDINTSKETNKMIKMMLNNKNIQIILLSNLKNTEILNLYNLIGDDKLLIHKIHKLKSIQQQFYKLLNPICTNAFDNFDSFYNSLNNETLDVKYIIFKNTELKYN